SVQCTSQRYFSDALQDSIRVKEKKETEKLNFLIAWEWARNEITPTQLSSSGTAQFLTKVLSTSK
ncbi:hypothetical protein, partial [Salmonella enterica]|uniref:hypothetical protein n=1 Tax=Salmonella enterica TaxID=28901 RepID=UPI001FAE63E1